MRIKLTNHSRLTLLIVSLRIYAHDFFLCPITRQNERTRRIVTDRFEMNPLVYLATSIRIQFMMRGTADRPPSKGRVDTTGRTA